jgi:hypothetical protein
MVALTLVWSEVGLNGVATAWLEVSKTGPVGLRSIRRNQGCLKSAAEVSISRTSGDKNIE